MTEEMRVDVNDRQRLPLHGIRVLDLTRLLPGALATLQLADLGADVVKLEVPPRGDYQRQMSPHLNGVSAAYTALNRDKRSVRIDYRNPRGLAAFHALLSTANVFVESAAPGSLRKYGLDFPALTQRNPRLVYCSISGFGQDGAWARRPAHGVTLDAAAGLLEIDELLERPLGLPVAAGGLRHSVLHTGYIAAMSICAALVDAARSGAGTHIDISCWEAALMSDPYRAFQDLNGFRAESASTPQRPATATYRTSDGREIVLAAVEPPFWTALCKTIGRPNLCNADGSPPTSLSPLQIYDQIAAVLANQTLAYWTDAFEDARVPFAPVLTGAARFSTDHATSRGLVREQQHTDTADPPTVNRLRWTSASAKFGDTRGRPYVTAAPTLGQHTAEVLCEAGLSPRHVAELAADAP
jgi:alpha-methylacyl-CoA racemase